jgi:hypothetical protein
MLMLYVSRLMKKQNIPNKSRIKAHSGYERALCGHASPIIKPNIYKIKVFAPNTVLSAASGTRCPCQVPRGLRCSGTTSRCSGTTSPCLTVSIHGILYRVFLEQESRTSCVPQPAMRATSCLTVHLPGCLACGLHACHSI